MAAMLLDAKRLRDELDLLDDSRVGGIANVAPATQSRRGRR
jgi:hypothetical protein